MALCMLAMWPLNAQVTTPANSGFSGDFVGWDNTMTTDALMIKHEANQPIEWYTNAVQRMLLNPDVTGPMGPGFTPPFPNVPRDGFLLLSGQPDAFTNGASRAPFTRLHLIDDATGILNPVVYAQEHGFRPWQRNGITFTGNSDQSYIGHKYAGNDNTDFVIQWSDNPDSSPWGTDRLKFVFTTTYSAAAPRGAATMEGVEAMRFWPKDNAEVNVGVGDFAPPAIGDPTERLDILDGRLRIRELPNDPPTDDRYLVMVVDNTADTLERGVVKWVDPNDLPGGGVDCDWEITPNLDVVTAYDQSAPSGCPNDESRVGIGIDRPDAKLHVYNDWENMLGTAGFFHNVYGSQVASGLNALCEGGGTVIGARGRATMGGRNIGVWGIADNGPTCVGTRGEAYGTATNTGVEGTAYGGGTSTGLFGLGGGATNVNFGVSATGAGGNVAYGINATGQFGGLANYGIRAAAFGFNAYAGWFDGDTWTTGTGWYNNGLFSISDGSLKTAIEPIENALDLVMQLAPKRYLFNVEAHPHMQLSAEPQIGLIAQEVAQTVPELVGATVYPAQFDSLGNMTSEALSLKGVDYAKLGPLLVGAIQEQQRMISELQQQHHALQAALANCCALPGNDADQRMGSIDNSQLSDPTSERLLTIAPNPFTDRTTVSYTLERGGRAQLLVNSSDGKHLQVLEEGERSEGQYNYTWSTAHLAPGVYYVTLLLDGEPLVKRAVKVQ